MQQVKKIMAAIGFSDYAQGTFNYAADLARCLNAELIVGSIINSRDVEAVATISSMGYEVDGENYVDGIKEERKKRLAQLLEASSYDKESIKTVFRVGNPIDELLKITVREKVDMVVMGLKGRTDLEQMMVGSVAEKLFRRCPVTVVSYRDEKHSRRLLKRISME